MIRELKGNHGGELIPSGSYWANYYSSVPLDTAGSLNVFFFSPASKDKCLVFC